MVICFYDRFSKSLKKLKWNRTKAKYNKTQYLGYLYLSGSFQV